MKSSHCPKYEQKNQIVTYLYIMSCTYMFQNLMKKQVNIKKSQLRMQISKPFLFFCNHVYFCAYYVFRANANQIIDAISEITSTLLYTWDRNILVGYFYFVRHHFWKITFDILKIVCGCLIHKTYALSFYRSQNVLCWSKFFEPKTDIDPLPPYLVHVVIEWPLVKSVQPQLPNQNIFAKSVPQISQTTIL